MTTVCAQLPRLSEMLRLRGRRAAGQLAALAGTTSVEVVCLLALLVKTRRSIVFETLLSAQVLQSCAEAMFAFPWNTLLHNAVRSLFQEVCGSREEGLQIILSFLSNGPLMARLVSEHRAEVEQAHSEGRRRRTSQVGFMGHLRSISEELCELGKAEGEVAAVLAGIEGWNDFVVPDVDAMVRLRADALGGLPFPGSASDAFLDANGQWSSTLADLVSGVALSRAAQWFENVGDQDIVVIDEDICCGGAPEGLSTHEVAPDRDGLDAAVGIEGWP